MPGFNDTNQNAKGLAVVALKGKSTVS